MKILLPDYVVHQIVQGLEEARYHEIGGILMGEHIDVGYFRICEITLHSKDGTLSQFIRSCTQALRPLVQFFEKTRRNYRRFNYMGEWHSHPSFSTTPSIKDHTTMWEIVHDKSVGANFAVLLIVRLDINNDLKTNALVYVPGHPICEAEVLRERISNE